MVLVFAVLIFIKKPLKETPQRLYNFDLNYMISLGLSYFSGIYGQLQQQFKEAS
jgi:hypothetical protein